MSQFPASGITEIVLNSGASALSRTIPINLQDCWHSPSIRTILGYLPHYAITGDRATDPRGR